MSLMTLNVLPETRRRKTTVTQMLFCFQEIIVGKEVVVLKPILRHLVHLIHCLHPVHPAFVERVYHLFLSFVARFLDASQINTAEKGSKNTPKDSDRSSGDIENLKGSGGLRDTDNSMDSGKSLRDSEMNSRVDEIVSGAERSPTDSEKSSKAAERNSRDAESNVGDTETHTSPNKLQSPNSSVDASSVDQNSSAISLEGSASKDDSRSQVTGASQNGMLVSGHLFKALETMGEELPEDDHMRENFLACLNRYVPLK